MTRDNRERLLLLAAGASMALAGLLLLGRGQRSRPEPSGGGSPGSRPVPARDPDASQTGRPREVQPAWKTFGDGLRDEWSEWMERRTPPEVDPGLLRTRLAALPGGEGVQVGLLGPGIVEVVGTVSGPDESRALLAAAAGEPGVRTVVNRLWVEGDVD